MGQGPGEEGDRRGGDANANANANARDVACQWNIKSYVQWRDIQEEPAVSGRAGILCMLVAAADH